MSASASRRRPIRQQPQPRQQQPNGAANSTSADDVDRHCVPMLVSLAESYLHVADDFQGPSSAALSLVPDVASATLYASLALAMDPDHVASSCSLPPYGWNRASFSFRSVVIWSCSRASWLPSASALASIGIVCNAPPTARITRYVPRHRICARICISMYGSWAVQGCARCARVYDPAWHETQAGRHATCMLVPLP